MGTDRPFTQIVDAWPEELRRHCCADGQNQTRRGVPGVIASIERATTHASSPDGCTLAAAVVPAAGSATKHRQK
eukprot:1923534-Prymnesium_polylepis.1